MALGLSICSVVKAKLYIKLDAILKFHRPRPLPLILKAKIRTPRCSYHYVKSITAFKKQGAT